MDNSPGKEANESAKILERFILSQARSRKFTITDYRDNLGNGDLFSGSLLIRDVPYVNLYGDKQSNTPGHVLVSDSTSRTARVKCHWQQTSGSVDKKFVFYIEDARHAVPEKEVVFILDGGGISQSALDYIKSQAKQTLDKKITVVNQSEFRDWFRGFCTEKLSLAREPMPLFSLVT